MYENLDKYPLVSIAMCTYNGESHIIEQLDSLINQTYINIEIIIVDDYSSDKTIDILNQYKEQYSHIQLFQNPQNLGYVKNFEKALQLTSGDYIALCDQDDIWDLRKIETQMNEIGDSLLNYHDSNFISEDGKFLNKKMSDILNMYSGSSPEPFLFFNCVSGHSILMKRALLEHILPFSISNFHDRQIAFKAANLGSISYINKQLVSYRQHPKSDTNILKLERKKKDHYERHSALSKLENEIQWIQECSQFEKNRNPEFIKNLCKSMSGRKSKYWSLRLPLLMYNHMHNLFFIQKKSNLSKLNFIAKQMWGLKMKSRYR